MTLSYLDFDYSEDYEGVGTFDAMASVSPQQWPALQSEVAQVLTWCQQQFLQGPAPLEDGGDWDYDLQGSEETVAPLALQFNAATGAIERRAGAPGAPRITLTLSVSGSPSFCQALRSAFDLS
jgi:hypothetical protein